MNLPWKYAIAGFGVGAGMEYLMIKFDFYSHVRVSESRKRLQERMDLDDAVERLAVKYPQQFGNLPERWNRIKEIEDSLD